MFWYKYKKILKDLFAFLRIGICGFHAVVSIDETRSIDSPNFPDEYPTNILCQWIITASNGRAINITFNTFSTNENLDTLTVRNKLLFLLQCN